ncbi:MAG: DUF411 domain-containing protein [Proteobacteria bacterium]|nr:DUF411 domain-containing protein [Pseudomonadota bacterium]
MLRRDVLRFFALCLLQFSSGVASAKDETRIEVWKSPSCGCCKDWITHLKANGFKVDHYDTGNNRIRSQVGMPQKYGSCHTAIVEGYVIEGHVPADDIRKLLALKPKALGLSVPGMPVGAPGMDAPEYQGRQDPFDVLLIVGEGHTVFSSYHKN